MIRRHTMIFRQRRADRGQRVGKLIQQIRARYGTRRGRRGMDELAAIVGFKPCTVSSWLAGARVPSEQALAKLQEIATGPPQNLFALLYDMYRDEHGTAQEKTA